MVSLLRHVLCQSGLFLMVTCLAFMCGSVRSVFASDIGTARKQFKTGQYAECLESARKAIEDNAFQVEWRTLMIESRMALGQYGEASAYMDTALQHYSLSLRLMRLAHTVYLQNGQSAKAAEMLAKIYRIAGGRRIEYLDSEDLVILGEAALLFGAEPRLVLGEFYDRAVKEDPDYRKAYLAAGSLALAKQDYELAATQYRKAVERFGDDPDAHYGLAKAFYHSDRNLMVKSLDVTLHVNPRYAPALLLSAEHHIDCEDYDTAGKLLDRVVAVNPWHPEAWSYRAVLAHLDNDPNMVKRCRATALKFRSTNPQVDYLIGRKLSQKYRFAEGAGHQREALKFDSAYLPAKIQLAEDLLRLGEEQEGWALADEVHSRDAYSVEAYNLVNLRDNMSKFRTLTADGFILRMDKLEAMVYGDRVLKLLRQAKAALCAKYGLQLDGSVTVELFDNQQDFAVRTFGMPGGAGYLGVCFGKVITANSPRAEVPSNWEAMLWHEFCHVVTLNLTRNKMPRWLSEGISVYEESQRDPAWGHRMNLQYRKMILGGELTPVGNLSAAFLNPSSAVHLQFAYYESSLVVEFLIDRFGFDSIKAILVDLANGEDVNASISKHASPMEEIEKEFMTFARQRTEVPAPEADWEEPPGVQIFSADPNALAEWLAEHPNSFLGLTLQANRLLAKGKWEAAKKPLEKLILLYPEYASENNAYRFLADAHRQLDEIEQERQVLDKLATVSSDATYAYGRLMEIGTKQERWQDVVDNGEKHLAVYPLSASVYRQLGRANEELGRDEQALESYRRLLWLGPEDPADVNYRMARLLQGRDPMAAKRHVLDALADAPRFRKAHSLLLKIVDDIPKPSAANSEDQVKPPTIQEDTP